MAYIYPILGWMNFRAAGTPLLPSFYTEYYSQEDRLKSMAIILQRIATWGDVNAEKINEMIEVLNNTGAVDVSELIERMNDIEAEFGSVETAVQNQLDAFLAEIQELSTAVDEANGLIQDFEADVNAILAKNTEQDGKISALETFRGAIQATVNSHGTRITALETAQAGVNTSISNLSGKVTALETLTNGFDNRIASAESAVSSIQADVNAIKAVKTTNNITSSVNVTSSGATINVNYNEKNIDGTGSVNKSASVPLTSSDSSVTFASYTSGGSQGVDIKAVGGGGSSTELENRVTSVEGNLDELSTTVTANSTSINELGGRVTTLENNPGGDPELETRVTLVEGEVDSLGDRVTTLEGSSGGGDPELETRVIDLETRVTENTADIDNNETWLGNLDGRVSQLESSSGGGGGGDAPGISTQLTGMENNLDETITLYNMKNMNEGGDLEDIMFMRNTGWSPDFTVDYTADSYSVNTIVNLSDVFLARIDTLEMQLADALARIEALETP